MRVGVTRATLRAEVQIETGESTGAGHATQTEPRINHLLNRTERELSNEFVWPYMTRRVEQVIPANTKVNTLPPLVFFTGVLEVHCLFGGDWLPVYHGIEAEHLSLYDDNARATPIQRWRIRYPGTLDFDVWPVSPQDETLRWLIQQQAGAMTTDSDVCMVDGDVLVLRTAAHVLIGKKDYDGAKAKLAAATSLIKNLLYRQVGMKKENYSMVGPRGVVLRPGIDFIPPSA
ncbi:MAG: hypothetical protein KAX54_00295 [Thauera sp.]|nr:hypothetical protein [Thauera sp.]